MKPAADLDLHCFTDCKCSKCMLITGILQVYYLGSVYCVVHKRVDSSYSDEVKLIHLEQAIGSRSWIANLFL